MLDKIASVFPLTEQDIGAYAHLSVSGMKFHIRSFEARGLGHVSYMRASGMLGLMKMETLIINARERDVPLLSYDRIDAMGRHTLLLELYDTLAGAYDSAPMHAVKAQYAALPDYDIGTHWYDSLHLPDSLFKRVNGKKAVPAIDALTASYIGAYLASAAALPACAPAPKTQKSAAYVSGLLTHGGPSTDVFMKALGKDKTKELFEKILFGTEQA